LSTAGAGAVYRLIGDRESARDVCQEALLAVARGLAGLSDPRSFRPWMYRIATFKSRDWQRRQYREPNPEPVAVEEIGTSGAPSNEDVQDVLATMGAMDQALLSLFYFQGMSIAQLATSLAISEAAVKTRLFRARQRFKQHWQGDTQ